MFAMIHYRILATWALMGWRHVLVTVMAGMDSADVPDGGCNQDREVISRGLFTNLLWRFRDHLVWFSITFPFLKPKPHWSQGKGALCGSCWVDSTSAWASSETATSILFLKLAPSPGDPLHSRRACPLLPGDRHRRWSSSGLHGEGEGVADGEGDLEDLALSLQWLAEGQALDGQGAVIFSHCCHFCLFLNQKKKCSS